MGGRGARSGLSGGVGINATKHNRQMELLNDTDFKSRTNKAHLKNLKETYNDFNNYRFDGLNHNMQSNNYMTMDRISKDGDKVVVRVANSHIVDTKYGYGLVLNKDNVVYLKDWQVSKTNYGNEVLLNKKYFTPKKSSRTFSDFDGSTELLDFSSWQKAAKAQQKEGTNVKWRFKNVKE